MVNAAVDDQQAHHKVGGRLLRFFGDHQFQHRVLQKHQAHGEQADAFGGFHGLEQVVEVLRVKAVFLDVFEVEGAQVDFNIIERFVDQGIGQQRVDDRGFGLARTVLLGLGFSALGAFFLFVWGGHGGRFLVRDSGIFGPTL